VEYVCNYYDIPVAEIKSDSRKKDIAIARQLLMLIARENFDWTLKRI
jgi:chromosomal replication initiation ATPase DnaA